MKLVSLAQLRADTLLFANQRSSSFVTPDELDRLINLRLARLYDLLVEARGHEYYESTATLATTPASAIVALPADFYQLITVLARWGPQELEEIDSLDHLGDQTVYRNWNQWAQYSPKAWRIRGQLLEFFPTPTAITTLELRYVPACPTLVEGSSFDGVNGWEVLVASGAAMDLLGLQALPFGSAERIYAEAMERIRGLAADRAAANPVTIRDERFRGDRDTWWRRLPRAVP